MISPSTSKPNHNGNKSNKKLYGTTKCWPTHYFYPTEKNPNNSISKYSTKSGGGWIITDEEGGEIVSGFNTGFSDITLINSHRAEIYGALSVFMIINEYYNFYRMELKLSIQYYCDSNEVITKLRNITQKNRNY